MYVYVFCLSHAFHTSDDLRLLTVCEWFEKPELVRALHVHAHLCSFRVNDDASFSFECFELVISLFPSHGTRDAWDFKCSVQISHDGFIFRDDDALFTI